MIPGLILVAVGLVFWEYLIRPRQFVPGPRGIPILGHLHLLGPQPHKTFIKWKKLYGPMIGIWLGSFRTVVIQDAKLVREGLNLSAFSGRPALKAITVARSGGVAKGIFFTDGREWSEQRRFALRALREVGFGTKHMEGKVQEGIQELLETLKGKEGEPIQARSVFQAAVVSALWRILFGRHVDQQNPEFKDAINRISSSLENPNMLESLGTFIPWLGSIFPMLSGYAKMVEDSIPINGFMRKRLGSHNNILENQNRPRDFVDAYTDKVKQTTDPTSSFHPKQDTILFALLDLFGAGLDSTSTTLSWMCAYFIHYPQIQDKFQKEIDGVIGRERRPTLADRPKMPYAEAVITEVLRHSSIVPLSYRRSVEDIEFHGILIPKDTMVIFNLYESHFDEAAWGDPQNFRPERFLHGDISKLNRNQNFVPFSAGKRACIGDSLARDELFLFSTSFFQIFVTTSGKEPPSLEPHLGLTLTPKPFEMILKRR